MRSLITLKLSSYENTLKHAQSLLKPFGLNVDDNYGLVMISPKRSLYVVRVEGQVNHVALSALPEFVGVYGDVKIAPIDRPDGNREETNNG